MSAVCERCSVSGVCGVNQPIVLDHVHHPGSPENELPCRGKTPRPHRPHRGSWPFALHQRYAPLSLTYSSTVTRLWMDFSRQILIESSVTSLGLKQMSISNYGSWSRSVFHFCFAWHPHLFYIPISPVRWDRVCFCTLSLNSYSITSKFLPRTFGDMVDNIWVIGSHYNVFWRTKPNIYIIYTLAFWSYWYQAIVPHSFCYSTYYLRLRSPIDMDYHLMSNSIYLPVCQSNLASTILASLLTAESNGFSWVE